MVIKTQTEYQLSSPDQPKKFPDLEAQKLACNHPEEGRRVTPPTPSHAAQWSLPGGGRAGEMGRVEQLQARSPDTSQVGGGPLLTHLLSAQPEAFLLL